MPQSLTELDFAQVIRLTPLVAIDLIIRDSVGRVLLGLRNSEPAKGQYFVPGGRILKGERHKEAFARISKSETNCEFRFEDARLLGIYDHIYSANALGEPGYGTHYVTLAYEVRIHDLPTIQPDYQHAEYRWMYEDELLASSNVHSNTKAYFTCAAQVASIGAIVQD